MFDVLVHFLKNVSITDEEFALFQELFLPLELTTRTLSFNGQVTLQNMPRL
jgi:hypothetical protein